MDWTPARLREEDGRYIPLSALYTRVAATYNVDRPDLPCLAGGMHTYNPVLKHAITRRLRPPQQQQAGRPVGRSLSMLYLPICLSATPSSPASACKGTGPQPSQVWRWGTGGWADAERGIRLAGYYARREGFLSFPYVPPHTC